MAWSAIGSKESQILDLHLSTLCALLFNANRGKNQRAARIEDFMQYKPPPDNRPIGAKIRQAFAPFLRRPQRG